MRGHARPPGGRGMAFGSLQPALPAGPHLSPFPPHRAGPLPVSHPDALARVFQRRRALSTLDSAAVSPLGPCLQEAVVPGKSRAVMLVPAVHAERPARLRWGLGTALPSFCLSQVSSLSHRFQE